MVPKWVRGRESLELVEPIAQSLPMLGLGNSVGTPRGRHRSRRDRRRQLRRARDSARRDVDGKIVLFNVPFTNYGADGRVPLDRPVARRGARRGRDARAIRRADRPAHAAHRRH